jgi:hypothetical protein
VYRHEAYWEKEQSLEENVEIAWTAHKTPADLSDVAANLPGVMSSLHDWSKKKQLVCPTKKIEKLRKELMYVSKWNDYMSQRRKREIEKELNMMLEREEIYWRQVLN